MTGFMTVLFEYVITFLGIVIIVQLLKRRALFKEEYQTVFDRLVTEFALPAVIFSSLASISYWDDLAIPSAILFTSIIVSAIVIYAVCQLLQLPRKTTGALVMVGAFGSTATLAAPVIETLFGEESITLSAVLAEGAVGVAIPFFTIGVLIAVYFGMDPDDSDVGIIGALRQFLLTPIFIAFLLGLAVSILGSVFGIPGLGVFSDIYRGFFEQIQYSLELLVWIAAGLMIRPLKLKVYLPFLGLIVVVKMVLQPILAMICSTAAGLPVLQEEALIILAAMPSGAIATVLANRYGCDGRLAAGLLVGTYVVMLVIFPAVAFLFV